MSSSYLPRTSSSASLSRRASYTEEPTEDDVETAFIDTSTDNNQSTATVQSSDKGKAKEVQREAEYNVDGWFEALARDTGIASSTIRTSIDMKYWGRTVDPRGRPSTRFRQTYVAAFIAELRASYEKADEAYETFADSFRGWGIDDFKATGRMFKKQLLICLQEKGVVWASRMRDKSEQDDHAMQLVEMLNGVVKIRSPIASPISARTVLAQQPTSQQYVVEPIRTKRQSAAPTVPPVKPAPRERIENPRPKHEPPYDIYQRPSAQSEPQYVPYDHIQQPHPRQTPAHPYQSAQPIPPPAWQRQSATPQPNSIIYPTFNPYELPPRQHIVPERLPPEKIAQFQKTWKKENCYTGKPYDILADKAVIFIDLCRRLDIAES